jgi:formate dehydrogenase subunit delta
MSELERLVAMVNHIATHVECEPDPAAVIADHLQSFWAPRMKRMILAYDGDGLSTIAREAVRKLA